MGKIIVQKDRSLEVTSEYSGQWLILNCDLILSICHTTRAPRNKEENLEDYCFVTQEEFEQGVVMVRSGIYLYCAAFFFFYVNWVKVRLSNSGVFFIDLQKLRKKQKKII